MLRKLFCAEAHDALETVTTRVLAGGSSRPSPDALAEMMRVTHTLKGAAGTVGLTPMVDLSHRLESALAVLGRDDVPWTAATGDLLVEVADGLRAYLDRYGDAVAASLIDKVRDQIDRLVRPNRHEDSIPPVYVDPLPEPILEPATMEIAVVEPKTYLRVEPERIDALMSIGRRAAVRPHAYRTAGPAAPHARPRPRAHPPEPARYPRGRGAESSRHRRHRERACRPGRSASVRPRRRCSTRSRRCGARSASSSAASRGSAWKPRAS